MVPDIQMNFRFPKQLRIGIAVIAAIVLQALVIHQLRSAGLIDKIIPWDECAYIYMGISNAFAMTHGYWTTLQYAHSPLAIVPATIAAIVIPLSGTAPYWFNVIYLIGLFILIDRCLRRFPFSGAIAFVMVMVTTPFMFIFTSHIKTDFHGGILLFALLSLLFNPDGEDEAPAWLLAALSILILMAKPMAFYLPILLTAVFVLSAFNRYVTVGRIERRILTKHALVLSIALVAYAVLVIPNLTFFKEYIAQALSPLWASNLPFRMKLSYYLPFVDIGQSDNPDASGFWGRNYVSFAAILIVFALTTRKSTIWRPAVLLALIAIISLVPTVVSPQQQWSFGSFFAGSVMALMFYMMRIIQRSEHARKVNWFVIAASAFAFSIPVMRIQSWVPHDPTSLSQAKTISDDFVAKMDPTKAGNPEHPAIFFPFIGPIPDFDIGIRYFKQYWMIPSGLNQSYSVDQSVIDGGLNDFAYIIMVSNDLNLAKFTESNRNIEAYQQKIKDRWNLKELSRLPYAGTDYILYRVLSMKQ